MSYNLYNLFADHDINDIIRIINDPSSDIFINIDLHHDVYLSDINVDDFSEFFFWSVFQNIKEEKLEKIINLLLTSNVFERFIDDDDSLDLILQHIHEIESVSTVNVHLLQMFLDDPRINSKTKFLKRPVDRIDDHQTDEDRNFWIFRNRHIFKTLINHPIIGPIIKNTYNMSDIHCACYNQDINKITSLLEEGVNISCKDMADNTPLHALCMNVDIDYDIFKMFINHPIFDPNIVNYKGTVLSLICANSEMDPELQLKLTVALLERFDTDPTKRTSEKQNNPLHFACCTKNVKLIRLLYDRIDVNQQGLYGNTPLHFAISHQNEENVCALLEKENIDTMIPDRNGSTSLFRAVTTGNPNLFKLIAEKTPKIKKIENDLIFSFFFNACYSKNRELIEYTLNDDCFDPNIIHGNASGLQHILTSGNIELIELLLNHPRITIPKTSYYSYITYSTPNKYEVLKLIIKDGRINIDQFHAGGSFIYSLYNHPNTEKEYEDYIKITKLIIEHSNIDPSASFDESDTILHNICRLGFLEVLKLWLEKYPNTNLNIQGRFGNTLLHCAVNFFHSAGHKLDHSYNLVNFLLNHENVDHTIKNKNNHSAFYYACKVSCPEIVELLINSEKFDVNEFTNSTDSTILSHLCSNIASSHEDDDLIKNKIPIIMHLLKCPLIDVNKPNTYDVTPLHSLCIHAKCNSHYKLIKYMCENVKGIIIPNEIFYGNNKLNELLDNYR